MAYTSSATVITPGKWTLMLGLATADQEFSCDAGGVHLASDAQTTTVAPTLCAPGYDDIASVNHSLTLDFQAFLDEAASLWFFLWDNAGAEAKFEFTGTNAATAPTTPFMVSGTVRLVKPPLDAVAGEVVTGSVTLPCTVEPTVTKPVALAGAAVES
jgi:hypothetical protein